MTAIARVRLATILLLLAAGVSLGVFYGLLRSLVAVGVGGAIVWVGGRYLESVMAAPAEPEITDVGSFDLRYVCTMCGLELKVEKAAKDKAPTHCMEKMVLLTGPPGTDPN